MTSEKQDNRLDERTLSLLTQIDAELERQYAELSESVTDPEGGKMGEVHERDYEFSSTYERRKKMILEGKAEEVTQEIKRVQCKHRAYRWIKSAAVIVLCVSLLVLIVGPAKIQATVTRFGNAVLSIFTTHTDFVYDNTDKLNSENTKMVANTYLSKHLPKGFSIKETDEEDYNSCVAKNSDGKWISLKICTAKDLVLSIDTEDAEERNLTISQIPVKIYLKTGKTTLLWERQNIVFTLSGNVDVDILVSIVENILD